LSGYVILKKKRLEKTTFLDKDGKPQTERDCNLGPCKGLQFKTTDWELVNKYSYFLIYLII